MSTADPLHEYYQVKENCFKDICVARNAFGNKNTTEEQYDAMEKGLGIMFFHCPEEISVVVEATIQEASLRRYYFNFN